MRFVTVGVGGANLWARSSHTIFTTRDYGLFLPPAPENALPAWKAAEGVGFDVDFALVMAGFEFEEVFARRRTFEVEAVPIGVALLRDIIASKAAAGRQKDRLFLASHAEALKALIKEGD